MTTFATQATVALEEALRLVEHDYALTPVTITREASGKKKARFHRGWRHEASWSRDPDQIRAWWVDHPDTSFAIGCAVNEIEGVDLDVKPAEGIDAVSRWAEQGLPLGRLCQNTPSGGLHSIWAVRADGLALPQEAGKTLGRGIDTRNRSGLFFAAGSYVLGEAGNYEIVGELPHRSALTPTPDEVIALFADAASAGKAERPSDGRIVEHELDWQRRMVKAALDAVRAHPRDAGGYRKKLQHAGLFLGRIVEQGLLTAGEAEGMLRKAHTAVWGPEVWPENVKDIRDAIADGPRLERWRAPDRTRTGSSTEGDEPQVDEPGNTGQQAGNADNDGDLTDEELAARMFEREMLAEVRKLDVREAAAQFRAKRKRAGRPSIRSGLIDVRDLKNVPPPAWLVRGLVPDKAIGFLAGKYGTYKSFLAVSLACSLAQGKAWQGRDEWRVGAPVRVLYVAAEGAAGVAERVQAWEHAHGEIAAGMLAVYPKPVRLSDPDDAAEVAALVAEDGYGFVVIDTFHRCAPGVEENSSTEVGLILDAMAAIRDEHGTTTLFVDHTGHAGRTMRGTSSKGDDGEFVLLVDLPGDDRASDQQRTLRIAKLKDSKQDGAWPIRLREVPGIGEEGSAYLEIGEVGALDGGDEVFGDGRKWWDADPELPEKVAGLKGRGSTVAVDIFRVLAYVGGHDGLTKAEITVALKERPGKAPDRTAVHRALALLADEGITKAGEKAGRLVVADGLK